jgi:cyanophycinase
MQTATENGLKVFTLPAAEPTPLKIPTPAYALVGGGSDVDEAMKFLCENSGGGNIVILRASGDDDYNPYFHTLCPHNSVTTLLITSVEGARNPIAAGQIRSAHAIFIAGGDQSNYLKDWSGNPVQIEINAAIARGVPIGGISAGLAVLGEFVFSARMDTVTSPQALANPYDPHVTLDRDFLAIPALKGVITDSHFMARGRMGRTLVFLSRIVQDEWASRARAIGIDEGTAVLVGADGSARVVGKGSAYFIALPRKAEICADGKPLTAREFNAYSVSPGESQGFDLKLWMPGATAKSLVIQVVDGLMTLTRS